MNESFAEQILKPMRSVSQNFREYLKEEKLQEEALEQTNDNIATSLRSLGDENRLQYDIDISAKIRQSLEELGNREHEAVIRDIGQEQQEQQEEQFHSAEEPEQQEQFHSLEEPEQQEETELQKLYAKKKHFEDEQKTLRQDIFLKKKTWNQTTRNYHDKLYEKIEDTNRQINDLINA